MKQRPFYRWRMFWLGVVVLGFLGWAWDRSMDREEGVIRRGPGTAFLEAGVYQGVFRVIEGESDLDKTTVSVRWESQKFTRRMPDESRRWALRAVTEESYFMQKWWVAFPMWVPFAGWLGVWCGWTVWRWRRERRARLTEMEIEREVRG